MSQERDCRGRFLKMDPELRVMEALLRARASELDRPTVLRIAQWMLNRFISGSSYHVSI